MPRIVRQTRYAADRDGPICLLLEVRGDAREHSLQVYSYGKKQVVNLPRKLIRVETAGANRWAAITVPRWLANREGLHGNPDHAPVMSGFCRDKLGVSMTPDDAERAMAQFVVDHQNRYRRRQGQSWSTFKADRRNANIFS
jgi:hypothetical protein